MAYLINQKYTKSLVFKQRNPIMEINKSLYANLISRNNENIQRKCNEKEKLNKFTNPFCKNLQI